MIQITKVHATSLWRRSLQMITFELSLDTQEDFHVGGKSAQRTLCAKVLKRISSKYSWAKWLIWRGSWQRTKRDVVGHEAEKECCGQNMEDLGARLKTFRVYNSQTLHFEKQHEKVKWWCNPFKKRSQLPWKAKMIDYIYRSTSYEGICSLWPQWQRSERSRLLSEPPHVHSFINSFV